LGVQFEVLIAWGLAECKVAEGYSIPPGVGRDKRSENRHY